MSQKSFLPLKSFFKTNLPLFQEENKENATHEGKEKIPQAKSVRN
jgi:hypothetical protein